MGSTTGLLALLSTWHVVAILAVVLLLFGGKKLPELARGLAKGLRIFRDELHGTQKDVEDAVQPPPQDAQPPQPPQPPAQSSAPSQTVEKK
jgi:sec-independent protein translocase protein TatA